MKGELIIQGNRLREVIREELTHALCMESVHASEGTEFYLVNLLSEYHAAGNIQGLDEDQKPLAQRFLEAMSQPATSKAMHLKEIGDATLITLGFFADNIRRTIMNTKYYISFGGAAYHELATIMTCDLQFASIYAELAQKFAELTEVIAHMAPWNHASTDTDLLQIYKRWLATGDEHLGLLLRKAGIINDESHH